MSIKISRKNPFRSLFLAFAIISCLTLSAAFYYISNINNGLIRTQNNQEKVELLMRDFENQLQVMKDISLKIASNYEFHPYYFNGDVSREMSLLKKLEQYRYFSALSEEYFLYYGGDRIYRSTGKTLNLNVFVQSQSKSEGEQDRFLTELFEMRDEYPNSVIKLKAMSVFEDIYILSSFAVNEHMEQTNAIMGFAVKKSSLEDRFQIICGGIGGNIALYRGEEKLYCNYWDTEIFNHKDVLTADSLDGVYTMYYLPEKENNMQNSLFFLQVILVSADVFLVFMISVIYAERAYKPIRMLSEKYRERMLDTETESKNALEEVADMMNSMLQKYTNANVQIEQTRQMLKNQVLRLLISGNASLDVLANLEAVEVQLPGPYFYVMSIFYEEDEGVTEIFLNNLSKELELLSDEEKDKYVYAICEFGEKMLHVICNVKDRESAEELTEIVCNIAEGFGYKAVIGMGNVYKELSFLPASWLESMDVIQNKKMPKNKRQKGFIYDSKDMYRIWAALETENEEEALEMLDRYVRKLEKENVSLLMLQYIFADFLSELTKLSGKYGMELSRQNVSLFVAAKDVQGFRNAAQAAIRDFCKEFVGIKFVQKEGELFRIYEHINAHFAEYDMSIEKVAEDLHTNIGAVRSAVLKHTGKTYKEYVIYLRIEYAKVLLCQENMTVAKVCEQVGYGNISYFITLFKDITGVTPAKYRKNMGK